MERKELDEKILAAITTLNSEGKSLTVINIEQITGLLKYQIYTSKYKSQLEIRGKKARAIHKTREIQRVAETSSVAKDSDEALAVTVLGKKKVVSLNLSYKLLESALEIDMKEATTEDIDAAIETLTFLFKKSIKRLELEKSRLQ
jgi:hypothetical protein